MELIQLSAISFAKLPAFKRLGALQKDAATIWAKMQKQVIIRPLQTLYYLPAGIAEFHKLSLKSKTESFLIFLFLEIEQ